MLQRSATSKPSDSRESSGSRIAADNRDVEATRKLTVVFSVVALSHVYCVVRRQLMSYLRYECS